VTESTSTDADQPDGTGQPDQTRTARKRQAILQAATTLFLRDGYAATSMDQVAAAAAVSKQTVYKQFADKQSLFRAIVTGTVEQVSDPVAHQVANLGQSANPEADLRVLARALLAQVIQPRVTQLRRLVIAEAGRFPELGRLFYERGPGRTIDALATAFKALADRGVLQLDDSRDPRVAAEHFNWLVISTPMNQVMLCGDAGWPEPAELDRHADAGVRAFLDAYRAG